MIELMQGFKVGAEEPIDNRLVLSWAEMKEIKDYILPDLYFALCRDDGLFYIYNKSLEPSEKTGKFRLANVQIEFDDTTIRKNPEGKYSVNQRALTEKLDVIKEAAAAINLSTDNIYRTENGFEIKVEQANLETGAKDSKVIYVEKATEELAGLMSAQDKKDLEGLKTSKADLPPKCPDWLNPTGETPYPWFMASLDVESTGHGPDAEGNLKAAVGAYNFNLKNYYKWEKSIPLAASEDKAGLMTAKDKKDLANKADKPGELPPELKVPGVDYPWFMISLDPKGIDAEGNFKFEHSGYSLNTKQYYTWKDKSMPMAATDTTGGFITAEGKKKLDAAITKAVEDLVHYYTKDETYTKQQVDDIIATIKQFKIELVDNLPEVGQEGVLYLLKKIDSEGHEYREEWLWVEDKWEIIGNTKIDLKPYAKITYVDEQVAKKLDLMPGDEHTGGNAYNLPYFFYLDVQGDQIIVHAKTRSLDGKNVYGDYALPVTAATTSNAGLMSSADKLALINAATKAEVTSESDRAKGAEAGLQTNINNVQAALNQEAQTRAQADNTITQNLIAESNARAAAIKEVKDSISKEAADRLQGDQALNEQVGAEISARSQGDQALQLLIEEEIGRAQEAEGNKLDKITIETVKPQVYVKNPDGSQTMADLPEGAVVDTEMRDDSVNAVQNKVIKAYADAIDNKKVDKEITGSKGKAKIFNESDGGGSKFERTDGASYVGVHNEDNGVGAQIYDVDSSNKGVILDITRNGAYYHTGDFKPASQRDVDENEIATKKDFSAYRTSSAQDVIDNAAKARLTAIENQEETWNNKQEKIEDLADIRSKANGAIQDLGKAPDGGPYRLTYFYKMTPEADKITVTAETIAMDSSKEKKEFSLSVPSATTDTAGLLSATDKSKLDNIVDVLCNNDEFVTKLITKLMADGNQLSAKIKEIENAIEWND